MLATCDALWAALPPWRSEDSGGMRAEIAEAGRIGIPVRDVRTAEKWAEAICELHQQRCSWA